MRRLILPSIAIILLATIPIAMLLFSIDPAAVAKKWEGSRVAVELKNTSQYIKVVRMFWVDHPYKAELGPGPLGQSVAEIKPGKSFMAGEFRGGYSPGTYIFIWELCSRYYDPNLDWNRYGKKIVIPSGIPKVTITDKLDITPKEAAVIDEFIIER